jgi:hypothetical protein
MNLNRLVLVIPAKLDEEREAVARVWLDAGGEVERLERFWELPSHLERDRVRLYGNDTFCLVIAQKLDLTLVSPNEQILALAPQFLLKRTVWVERLQTLRHDSFPIFVKPVVPKQFRAGIYNSLDELTQECQGLESITEVLLSDIVTLQAEARAFVLDSKILTINVYEGAADKEQATQFAEQVVQMLELPQTCVIDVGLLDNGTWIFIEANPAWGAGLNGCDAVGAAVCISAATLINPLVSDN